MQNFVNELISGFESRERIVHVERIPGKTAKYGKFSVPLSKPLAAALSKKGIKKFYSHQVEAVDLIRKGKHVAVVTPTASGKTLIYNIPVIEHLLSHKDSKALYLYPVKALAQDQLKNLNELLGEISGKHAPGISAEIYDGDTAPAKRTKIRKNPPQILITNPDMLHLGLLPYHSGWQEFFRSLKFVVIDEVHTYRGIFGSHVAQIIRRLRRICRFYGSDPQFVALSATMANPQEFINCLAGIDFGVVAESGAPGRAKHFILWKAQDSPYTEATALIRSCLIRKLKTIVFTKSRKITDLIHRWLVEENPLLDGKISAYRAGYRPEERREIEKKLFSGELMAVISTSALETGIDVGELDVCILVGYPGTIMSTWQRSGRVGRTDREAVIVLIGLEDALDQYFIDHPRDFFDASYETAVIDEYNPIVSAGQISCAAFEMPLSIADREFYGENFEGMLEKLTAEGKLLRDSEGKRWFCRDLHPERHLSIRSIGDTFEISDISDGHLIGESEVPRVFRECHPGAIYLHAGEQYEAVNLDLDRKKVMVRQVMADYFTQPRSTSEIEILQVLTQKKLANDTTVRLGRVKVTELVTGFVKKQERTQIIMGEYELSLPPHVYETISVWIEIPEYVCGEFRVSKTFPLLDFNGGIHAIEHAAIAIMPLFAMCDRNDLAGLSTNFHPQVRRPVIFIHDSHPGGVGLSSRAYQMIGPLLDKTWELIRSCKCEEGCPSCIQDSNCGNGNKPLDKKAALKIIQKLLCHEISRTAETAAPAVTVNTAPGICEKKPEPATDNIVFVDLETQFLSYEIGGWGNIPQMRLSLGVTYNTRDENFRSYTEDRVQELIKELKSARLVVGFNIRNFDMKVLQPYTTEDLSKLPVFDILEEVRERLGFRLSLEHLGLITLHRPKVGDGIEVVQWFRDGRMDLVQEHCRRDVEITRDLFFFGIEKGYVLYENKENVILQLKVNFNK